MNTRPDIAAAVSIAKRNVANPGSGHWRAIQHILRYPKGTSTLGLYLRAQRTFNLTGFSDSDWAGDISTRWSTNGHVFQINGSTVSWKSKKQNSVALSSTEAEYIALSEATKELLWLKMFFDNTGINQLSITLNEDNQCCIALAKNPGDHPKTKHNDFIWEHVNSGIMDLQFMDTRKNFADIMTKPFGKSKFIELREMLNMNSIDKFLAGCCAVSKVPAGSGDINGSPVIRMGAVELPNPCELIESELWMGIVSRLKLEGLKTRAACTVRSTVRIATGRNSLNSRE